LPLKVDYLIDGLYASGGIVPVLKNNKVKLVPDAKLVYTFKEGTSVRLLGGISNIFNVNSLQKLYEINPFLITPDELTVFQQTNYYAGFDWLNAKGLQLQAKLGFVNFKNLPLFINEGPASADPSGKDFYVLNESSATAFFIESNLGYIFSDKLEFNSTLKAFSFQSQAQYVDPYGILPLELNLGLDWKPIQPLSLKMNGQLFGGNMAKEAGKLPFRTKGIFDLGLSVDYNLNKKWTLWIDLNNIANTRYQRWNGYTSFGFNFLLGIKFKFNQLAQ
jgi:outer membrane receptor protein involved in Fe transport